jgi:uncharacterized membrane protein YecN with MAPEG domain
MRIWQIMKAVDGSADWPENMNTAEYVATGVVYVTTVALLGFGAWAAFVIGWAVLG